jgi:aspartyl-tRNA(Asn)/glutamyl-tRNA(Gln) amidotransferase subunit A
MNPRDCPSGIFLALPDEEAPGIRLAVKDLFDTAGLVTTYGSPLFADHVPATTAAAVSTLEVAGYANVGKTNLHEFAYGTTSENPHFGVVPNPVAPGRVAGGSSGGNAAALVLDACDIALGTDSGGSVRIPAACCGVAGFKPSFGLVSLEGCFPLAPSFDHVGPMARDVATCEDALAVLVPEYRPRAIESLEEVEVGVALLDGAAPLVRRRVESAAELFPRRRDV